MLKLLLISFFVISCSSIQQKRDNNFTDERVSSFMRAWNKENKEFDEAAYKKTYRKYLDSVRKIFVKEGMAKNIDFYLDSLKSLDQNIANANEKFDQTDYESTEKTQVITNVYDKLLEDRSYQLLENYGFNFYSELMKNRNEFMEKKGKGFDFPL